MNGAGASLLDGAYDEREAAADFQVHVLVFDNNSSDDLHGTVYMRLISGVIPFGLMTNFSELLLSGDRANKLTSRRLRRRTVT